MNEGRPSRGHVAIVVAFVVLFMLLLRDTAMPPRRPALPPPLDAHAALRALLESTALRVDELHEAAEARQLLIMKDVASRLQEEFLLHARREEELLYEPAARKGLAGEVAALRTEHELLRRRLDDLGAAAEAPMPDHNAFARRAERLLGFLDAHLEVEERLLRGAWNGP